MLENADGFLQLDVFLFSLHRLGIGGHRRRIAGRAFLICTGSDGRDFGLLLLLIVVEMMRQVGLMDFRVLVELAAFLRYRRQRFLRRRNIDIRRDADGLDRAAGGV